MLGLLLLLGFASMPLPSVPRLFAQAGAHVPRIYAAAGTTLYAYDPVKGSLAWKHAIRRNANVIQIPGEGIAVETATNAVLLSARTGAVLWEHAPAQGGAVNLVGLVNGILYVVETQTLSFLHPSPNPDTLVAIDPGSGTRLWRFSLDHQHLGVGSVMGAPGDQFVYLNEETDESSMLNASVDALRAIDGEVQWRRAISNTSSVIPRFVAPGAVYAYGAHGFLADGEPPAVVGTLYRLDPTDGTVRWGLPVLQHSSQAFTRDSLYVSSRRIVSARDPQDLSVRWGMDVGQWVIQLFLLGNDSLGVQGRTTFSLLNTRDGSLRWQTARGDSFGAVVLASGVVCAAYVPDAGDLYGFDAVTGAERWHFVRGEVHAGTLTAAGGSGLYVGADQSLYALNPRDGAVRWSAKLSDAVGKIQVGL